jgi:hypothetical protein
MITGTLLGALACTATRTVPRSIGSAAHPPPVVSEPARAQLIDSSYVVFPEGFHVDGTRLIGDGWHHWPAFADSVRIASVAIDSVGGITTAHTEYDLPKSIAMTFGAVMIGVFAAVLALIGLCYASRCLE